jgi:hypothetical protein
MRYVCAISCCSPDLELADTLYSHFVRARIAAFFYRETSLGSGLMLNLHTDVYCSACVRLYLLREISFARRYPSLELDCGRGRSGNIVLPTEPRGTLHIPNGYAFVLDEGWHWVKHTPDTSIAGIVEQVLGCAGAI